MAGETTIDKVLTGIGFAPTAWTVILDTDNREALQKLCQTYWPPVYSYLRRSGQTPENAKDLTQGFFVHLLANERLKKAQPAQGKFRSFLLACLSNYVRNEWDKERTKKRGGGYEQISIDLPDTEKAYGMNLMDTLDPAQIYEQRWSRVLLTRVLRQLQERCTRDGKAELFAALLPSLSGEGGRGDHAAVAARLQMSEGAVRVAASRLREEFRQLLRAEIGQTVGSPAEIDGEIRHLFAAFRPA